MKILSAFLYGYLYSDILTGDQVTYQVYTAYVVMLYYMSQAYPQTMDAGLPTLQNS